MLADGFAAIVAQGFRHQLAVFVEIFHPLGQYGDGLAFNVILGGRLISPRLQSDVGRHVHHGFILSGLRRDGVFSFAHRRWNIIGRGDGIVFARFVNLHRLTVECGVGKMICGFTEVDQAEVILLGIFVNASAAPQNLLEFGHRTNFAVDHNQPAGLRIDPGGKQS